MKKLLFLLLIFTSHRISAQEFQEGTNVISAGLGLGGAFGSYSYSSQSPGLSLQYERGMWPIDGPGVISLGGYIGMKSYKYEYSAYNFSYKEKWNYTIIGIRSAYHYNGHNVEKLDIYGGAMLSYNILSYKFTSDAPANTFSVKGDYNNRIGFSLYLGGRYYLTDNLAGFLELGYGVSYANIGLALRLK